MLHRRWIRVYHTPPPNCLCNYSKILFTLVYLQTEVFVLGYFWLNYKICYFIPIPTWAICFISKISYFQVAKNFIRKYFQKPTYANFVFEVNYLHCWVFQHELNTLLPLFQNCPSIILPKRVDYIQKRQYESKIVLDAYMRFVKIFFMAQDLWFKYIFLSMY